MGGIGHSDAMVRVILALLINLTFGVDLSAQTTIPNPLHSEITNKPAPEPGTRSTAQRLMAEDTRACGADWKLRKPELSARGETWQSFAKACRQARKTARGV
jgi:hypothetical protein